MLYGAQRPRLLHVPWEVETSPAGEDAIDLAAAAGLQLDPWQQFVLHQALAERPDGRWSCFEVGLLVSRQNGKGSILEARELAGLFLFRDQLILHSAHQFDTALEAFTRILRLIEETPDLDKLVKKVNSTHGQEGIETKRGTRLKFKARTKRGGRGFSGDLVILDEAMYLPASVMGALMPTMAARPNPQIWYTASAVDELEHPDGQVLTDIRDKALKGHAPSLAWMEWSANPGVDADGKCRGPEAVDSDDRALWAQGNPGLGYRITEDYIVKERGSAMPRRQFAVERLGVGAWPKPKATQRPIDPDRWTQRKDASSVLQDPIVMTVDVSPVNRASIGVVGWDAEGHKHVEVLDNRQGIHWVVPKLAKLIRKWDPAALAMDGKGPNAVLLPKLQKAGIEPVLLGASDVAAACAGIVTDVDEDQIRHLGDPILDDGVAGLRSRPLAGGFAFAADPGIDISGFMAVTFGAWALEAHAPKPPPAAPRAIPRASGGEHGVDLMNVGF